MIGTALQTRVRHLLVWSLLARHAPDADILARACRHGEWIATRRGATPPYTASESGSPAPL